MRFVSVCSGIEAASVAWEPLGWQALAFAEIEPFPCAVLAHHWPTVPNLGDLTKWREWPAELLVQADVLIGGTPCQSFSVAGLRAGLDDARGNLSLEFVRLANAIDDLRRDAGRKPAYILWENVPGVLSDSTNGFGAMLGGLAGSAAAIAHPSGASWPDAGVVAGPARGAGWRCLSAQHFGLAQRRKRVFVLARGGVGNWDGAGALLPIGEGLSGVCAPISQKPASAFERSDDWASGVRCVEHDTDWQDCGCSCIDDHWCPYCDEWTSGLYHDRGDGCSHCGAWSKQVCNTLSDGAHMGGGLNGQDATSGRILVDDQGRPRRLSVTECARVQGFPDAHTAVTFRGKPAPDGPQYKALANSMATPCIRWIGQQIMRVEADHAAPTEIAACLAAEKAMGIV